METVNASKFNPDALYPWIRNGRRCYFFLNVSPFEFGTRNIARIWLKLLTDYPLGPCVPSQPPRSKRRSTIALPLFWQAWVRVFRRSSTRFWRRKGSGEKKFHQDSTMSSKCSQKHLAQVLESSYSKQ